MLPKPWTPLLVVAVSAAIACDGATEPDLGDEPVRTILVHDRDTGANLLWNTDGSAAGEFAAVTGGMLPIGAHARDGTVVLLQGSAIVLVTRGQPDDVDTLVHPAPASLSLATISPSARYVGLVAYAPTPGLLVYDRANRRLDTLSLAGAAPVLPPVFSPDDSRIALVSLTPVSILVTTVPLLPDAGTAPTRRPAISRFRNRLVFGWPRWEPEGLRLAVRRVATDGADTLVVAVFDPEIEGAFLEESFRVVLRPDTGAAVGLTLGDVSTYALSSDGTWLALGAEPGGAAGHAVYVATQDRPTLRTLLESPGQFPMFPLFIRE